MPRVPVGFQYSDLPGSAPRPVEQFRDPRGTRAFYESRITYLATERGVSKQTVRRDPQVQFAWGQLRLNLEREARQNQAARDFVLAERYRAGKLTGSEYRQQIMLGRHTTEEIARGHSVIQRPLTEAEYRDALERNRVMRGPQSAYAKALVILGLRPASATWPVGES